MLTGRYTLEEFVDRLALLYSDPENWNARGIYFLGPSKTFEDCFVCTKPCVEEYSRLLFFHARAPLVFFAMYPDYRAYRRDETMVDLFVCKDCMRSPEMQLSFHVYASFYTEESSAGGLYLYPKARYLTCKSAQRRVQSDPPKRGK